MELQYSRKDSKRDYQHKEVTKNKMFDMFKTEYASGQITSQLLNVL